MVTSGLAKLDTIKQKMQLVKGTFTPSEASDVILTLIHEKINFHRKQRFQKWEQNHNFSAMELDSRIKQLENDKKSIEVFIDNAKNLNAKIAINGILESTVVEN